MRFQNRDQSKTYLRRRSTLFGSTCIRLHPIYNTKPIFMRHFWEHIYLQLYYCVVSFTPKNIWNQTPPQIPSDQIRWRVRKNCFYYLLIIDGSTPGDSQTALLRMEVRSEYSQLGPKKSSGRVLHFQKYPWKPFSAFSELAFRSLLWCHRNALELSW